MVGLEYPRVTPLTPARGRVRLLGMKTRLKPKLAALLLIAAIVCACGMLVRADPGHPPPPTSLVTKPPSIAITPPFDPVLYYDPILRADRELRVRALRAHMRSLRALRAN